MITRKVTIVLEPRGDGGLYVYSDDVPGLILSHSDPAKIMADILPALAYLEAYRAAQVTVTNEQNNGG